MNHYTFNVLDSGDRCEYEILQNGVRSVFQDYDPDEPGQTPMTAEVAAAKAAIVVRRLQRVDLLPILEQQMVVATAVLAKTRADAEASPDPSAYDELVDAATGAVAFIQKQLADLS